MRIRCVFCAAFCIARAQSDAVEDLIWSRGALLSLTAIFLKKQDSELSSQLSICQKYRDIFEVIEERPTAAALAEKRGVTAEHLSLSHFTPTPALR